ncbi:MAG: bifunctional phosphopantothenoylcysteine decarboxylase/phosphopantothenate--cysteine ligase CoaBC [Acidimicrobiia bacterium]|nr:bifunctional phosphopantothenoylcysteine decarboxylase/phosphopantothenate--cysteine ligase CoaBC [Acidimicrobiia bacterium]
MAAYKAVELCRRLCDAGATVLPVMTRSARRFVGDVTFSALASEPARWRMFGADDPIPHTTLGRRADLVLVAPATANVLGKYAGGISDDLLTATLLATRAPVLVAPAMHSEMWEHPAVSENIATLRRRGVTIVEPGSGRLAGGDEGAGRLADPADILTRAAGVLAEAGPLSGRHVLVTAGGTREPIDAVRVITNRSSGKMGYALARQARRLGATVTLITTVSAEPPPGVDTVPVETASDMEEAVMSRAAGSDVIVMAAAVADFRPKRPAAGKSKKQDGPPEILLEATHDFLVDLGETKPTDQVLVGFAAETDDILENATVKLRRKNLDLIVANDVSEPGAGFDVDTNRAVILDPDAGPEEFPLMAKDALALRILERVATKLGDRSDS